MSPARSRADGPTDPHPRATPHGPAGRTTSFPSRGTPRAPARRIGPQELARLLGTWATPGQPAYVALAARVRLLVLDGRLPVGVRLPPERELAGALERSRTTAAAAYDLLRTSGHATSRQGSGTWTSLPRGAGASGEVPTWAPLPPPEGVMDLAHAAPSAPPQLHAAYADALTALPRYLPGTGYDYRGLPELRAAIAGRYAERGLPTSPEQILVTSGALQAVRLALALLVGPGDRVLVEQPGYPNVLDVVTDLGGRRVPVPVGSRDGWDVDGLAAAARQTSPRAAYLIPDFQNPSGARMAEDVRDRVAAALARTRTALVVDETLVELGLDGGDQGAGGAPGAPGPVPFAVHDAGTPIITVGSASKVFWGGLRIGWIRADAGTVLRLAALRSRQDLSSSVVEQLACARLLEDLPAVRAHRVGELRGQRDALVALLAARLPSWRFAVPPGGQVLWCELPAPVSGALAVAAGERGLRITPGSRFAADGTLESWLRLPYTRPVEELERAVELLASAWAHVTGEAPSSADGRVAPNGGVAPDGRVVPAAVAGAPVVPAVVPARAAEAAFVV